VENLSEMQDAVQIIRVTYEGVELFFKVGAGGINTAKDIFKVFQKLVETERLTGKTTVKDLLKSGGDLHVYQFDTEDMKSVKRLCKKYGVRYALLPDVNKADGKSELLFHSDATPRINQIIKYLKSGKIESFEDYIENGTPEELQEEYGIEKSEKKYAALNKEDFQLIGSHVQGKPGISIEEVMSIFDMSQDQMQPIIDQMQKLDIVEVGEDGTLTMKISERDFNELLESGKWKVKPVVPGEKAMSEGKDIQEPKLNDKQKQALMHSREISRDDPNAHQIFIAKSLNVKETETRFLSRIPYRKNEYIWMDKSSISHVSSEKKTIFANLDKDKEYSIVNRNGDIVGKRSGNELYKQSYDPVLRETQDMIRKKQAEKKRQKRKRVRTQQRGGR